MLSKENRLKKKKDFERVFKNGKGFREGFLFLKIIPNNLGINRFGFMVGKRLSKRATVRNRVRRKISEIVRLKLKDIKHGIDAVFVVFPGMGKNDLWEIEKIIDKLFERAKVLK